MRRAIAVMIGLAAWLGRSATARTATESSSGSERGSGSESGTTTDATGDPDEYDAETGPCLSVSPPESKRGCECEAVDGQGDAGLAALGLLGLAAVRRRNRAEIVDRLAREGRLPADVLARLRARDE